MNTEFDRAAAALDQPTASPGTPASPIDVDRVWQALSTVIDPEIGLDIVTLGLVYDLDCSDGAARVTFTLTTPACPLEEVIRGGIEAAVGAVPGVVEVIPEVVWEPRWHPAMIRSDAWS